MNIIPYTCISEETNFSLDAKEEMLNHKDALRWCAPDCPYCSFPEEEHLGGACRTFTALYCGKYKRLVRKSALCIDNKKDKNDAPDH
ncbi:MAG: hypothetical protein JW814_04060 [Candidatus Krumholzibacteriota bacterium]|nr:hypothetical protein [Candidatus Krumholzibacteriota bacterium]